MVEIKKGGKPVLFRIPGREEAEYQMLDNGTRRALGEGDKVLVEVEVYRHNKDLIIYGNHITKPALAIRKPAKTPITAGAMVRILGVLNVTGKALCRMTDGRWAVEYDAGGTLGVTPYDESCLEAVA